MAELLPLYTDSLCYSSQEDRLGISNFVTREGVADVRGGDLEVTTGGSGLNVAVASGGAFIKGDNVTDQGMYSMFNSGVKTVTMTAADATDPRIDTIVATVSDSTYGGSDDSWEITKLDGTPTTGATLANLNGAFTPIPDNTIVLAYVLVPALFSGPFVDATHILDARRSFERGGAAPRVDLLATAATSIPGTSTPTKIDLAEVRFLDDRVFSVTASVVTVLEDGVYDVEALGFVAGGAAGLRGVRVTFNGTAGTSVAIAQVSSQVDFGSSIGASSLQMAAGSTLTLCGVSDAANNTVHGSGVFSRMVVRKVG